MPCDAFAGPEAERSICVVRTSGKSCRVSDISFTCALICHFPCSIPFGSRHELPVSWKTLKIWRILSVLQPIFYTLMISKHSDLILEFQLSPVSHSFQKITTWLLKCCMFIIERMENRSIKERKSLHVLQTRR